MTATKFFLWSFFCVLPLWQCICDGSGEQPLLRGEIEANHTMFYVGENLSLHCSSLSNFSGEVYFQLGHTRVRQDDVTVVSATRAVLNKVVTASDPGETVVSCADSLGTVATTTIYTDYAPGNASHLSETRNIPDAFFYWQFDCCFRHTYDPSLIQFSAEWSYDASNASAWQLCYAAESSNRRCSLSDLEEWPIVSIRANITNVKRNDTVSTVLLGKGIRENADFNRMYYVGENVTMHCIKLSGFTGDVYFQYEKTNVSQNYVTLVNATHAVMSKPLTAEDIERTRLPGGQMAVGAGQLETSTFACFDSDGEIGRTDDIYTDYALQAPTDLVLYRMGDWKLKLTWDYNGTLYKFYNARTMDVTAEWKDDWVWMKCRILGTSQQSTCEIYVDVDNSETIISVRVTIANTRRKDKMSTLFPDIRVRDNVQPFPVGPVLAVALNSIAARVNVTSQYSVLYYNITFASVELGDVRHFTTAWATTEKSFVITGLHPAYTYTFDVRAKFDVNWGKFSKPTRTIPLKMPEAAPSSGPVVTPGAFHLDRSTCSNDWTTAKAYIYYQPIPVENRNGQIVNYTATVLHDGRLVTYRQRDVTHTIRLDAVPCHGHYDVTLRAYTAVGSSPPSLLTLSPWSQESDSLVDRLKLKVRLSDVTLTAEWDPVDGLQNSSLLLYYCERHTDTHSAVCQGAIRYVNISAVTGSYQLTHVAARLFGVAAVSGDGSTNGIKFTDCIYDPTKEAAPPSDVVAVAVTESRSIRVQWSGQEACDPVTQVIVWNYQLHVQDGTQNKTYIVAGEQRHFTLGEVADDRLYSFTVRANTTSGMTSFSQPPQTAVIRRNVTVLKDEEIAGIVLGVLLFLIVLGVLIFCFCRDKFIAVKAKFNRSADIPNPPQRPSSRGAGWRYEMSGMDVYSVHPRSPPHTTHAGSLTNHSGGRSQASQSSFQDLDLDPAAQGQADLEPQVTLSPTVMTPGYVFHAQS